MTEGSSPSGPTKLKILIMFGKKVEFEDEAKGIPELWKLIITVALVIGAFITANKITNNVYEQEMERQYPSELTINNQ